MNLIIITILITTLIITITIAALEFKGLDIRAILADIISFFAAVLIVYIILWGISKWYI